MKKPLYWIILFFSLNASAVFADSLRTRVSSNFISIISSAGLLESPLSQPLYGYRCHILFNLKTFYGHVIVCQNRLDPIIKLNLPLLHTKFVPIGKNLTTFRMEGNAFNEQLFLTLKGLMNSKDVYISKINACPNSQMNCSESYSMDLYQRQPSGSITCVNRNKNFACLLSPGIIY